MSSTLEKLNAALKEIETLKEEIKDLKAVIALRKRVREPSAKRKKQRRPSVVVHRGVGAQYVGKDGKLVAELCSGGNVEVDQDAVSVVQTTVKPNGTIVNKF